MYTVIDGKRGSTLVTREDPSGPLCLTPQASSAFGGSCDRCRAFTLPRQSQMAFSKSRLYCMHLVWACHQMFGPLQASCLVHFIAGGLMINQQLEHVIWHWRGSGGHPCNTHIFLRAEEGSTLVQPVAGEKTCAGSGSKHGSQSQKAPPAPPYKVWDVRHNDMGLSPDALPIPYQAVWSISQKVG